MLLTTIIFTRLVLVVRDEEQARSALAHRATHDELTGLVNRQELHAGLTVALQHRRGGGPVVHFLDLNGFKAVNDRYGHSAGDLVLTEVARRVCRQMRPTDIVARLGGDEFVVVTDDPADAADVSERLRDVVGGPDPLRRSPTHRRCQHRPGVSSSPPPTRLRHAAGRSGRRDVSREAQSAARYGRRGGRSGESRLCGRRPGGGAVTTELPRHSGPHR